MREPKEADVLRACLQFLKLRGIFAWRNNSTGIYDPTAKRYRTFNGLKGTADIIGIIPVDTAADQYDAPNVIGRFLAVETKAKRGKLSLEQAAFLDGIRARGGLAFVVRSVSELEAALKAEGVLA